jgi:hypothetical protein
MVAVAFGCVEKDGAATLSSITGGPADAGAAASARFIQKKAATTANSRAMSTAALRHLGGGGRS